MESRIGTTMALSKRRLVAKGDVVKQSRARLDAWAEAQKRFRLSDLPIQMARELGLNPKKFGGLATHRQELWKLPLPEFIAKYHIPPRLMLDSGVLHTLYRT
jgi:hypothetical protein